MKLKQLIRRIARAVLAVAAGLGIQSTTTQAAGLLALDHPNVRAVAAVQNTVTANLMKVPGVLGTAIGLEDSGEMALVIYVDQDSPSRADIIRALPPQIRGVAVKVELTEKFQAFAGKPPGAGGGGGVSHTAKQTLPIQLGTSGGWSKDLANGYCCGGTLGALINVATTDSVTGLPVDRQYILSNYHVFESDTVPGGNGTVATTGDNIIQPGLIDVNCNGANAQNVATLVKLSALPDHNVDCSVAEVIPGMVSGSILEIGPISSTTIGASLNQSVKKSGRTTGLSSSKVSGLNATISITYGNECAGGAAFTKTFTGQIVIANRGSKFLYSGDSGSLMVENVPTNPHAVGLLYAGSSSLAIANPIDHVLAFLSNNPMLGGVGSTATMVGN